MSLRRVFHFLLFILCFLPLEACNHHIEDLFDNIDQQDSTGIAHEHADTIQQSRNPSDSTQNPINNSDTSQTTITKPDTTGFAVFKSDTIIVGHWNIGNFSQGKSSNTTISAEDAKDMTEKYHSFLDSLNIDILGICELEPTFSKGGEKSQEVIFEKFPYYYIGKKYSYNCNAIFSKAELKDIKECLFTKRVQTRYYTMSTIQVNGKSVIFVETHLDWNQGTNGADCRKIQIDELLESFRNSPYVILCADYNTSSIDEFQPFVDAGFTLANGGYYNAINTYPASNPKSSIDNIIVKGFSVSNITVVGDASLSDHLLIKSVLVLKH